MKYRLFERSGLIYFDFTLDGKRYRKSSKLKYNDKNLMLIEKNGIRVLLNIIDEIDKETKVKTDFKGFAIDVIDSSAPNRKSSTQKDYLSKLDRLIFPYFGNYNIADIKSHHIDKWQNTLLGNYSTTTVKRCKSIMSMVFEKAIANDLILKNPVTYANKFSIDHEKKEPYTLEEMQKILKHSSGWLKTFLYLAFTTGMRSGELLGLQWEDIDYDKNVIYLKRSISKGVVSETSKTKNHNRLVIVPSIVMQMLKDLHIDNQSKWVFTSKLNEPYYETSSIVTYHFKPLLEMIGVKYKTLYATRHTYISIMRNAGASQDLILDIVGHSKEVSDKHYYTATVTNNKIDAVNNVFDAILEQKNTVK